LPTAHPFTFTLALVAAISAGADGSATRAVAAAEQDLPPLRWAADAEGGAPYIFKDPDRPDTNIGFEVELAAALADELGRRIEFVQYQFGSLVPGLQRGDFDLAMNGVEITPDRARVVRFSHPYYVYTLQLVVRADETRFETLEQCRAVGGTIATLEDTAAERLLDEQQVRKRIYDSQVEPYSDLEYGRVDAVLLDLPIALYYARQNPKLKFVGPPMAEGYYAIALRPQDETLAQQVDAALQRIAASGRLRQIYEGWGLWNDAQATLFQAHRADELLRQAEGRWTLADYLPLLLRGSWVTIQLAVLSMALAVLLGLPIALMRLSGWWPLQAIATLYVEFFRGIPVLLLLFFLYYGLPALGARYGWEAWLNLSAYLAAVLGFGLNYAAYESEIYRAGIGSIPIGQWEAAASLGMSRRLTFRRVILPQAIRVILPPMTNDFIALFKDTSLVSVIALVELTKQYQILAKSSMRYLEIGLATALLYLVMSVPLGHLARYLEKRWGKGL
jgi:polar amino acid transport system substrate-binding protein